MGATRARPVQRSLVPNLPRRRASSSDRPGPDDGADTSHGRLSSQGPQRSHSPHGHIGERLCQSRPVDPLRVSPSPPFDLGYPAHALLLRPLLTESLGPHTPRLVAGRSEGRP